MSIAENAAGKEARNPTVARIGFTCVRFAGPRGNLPLSLPAALPNIR
jgi:hypothetical protein